jgi:hypothetical protein
MDVVNMAMNSAFCTAAVRLGLVGRLFWPDRLRRGLRGDIPITLVAELFTWHGRERHRYTPILALHLICSFAGPQKPAVCAGSLELT